MYKLLTWLASPGLARLFRLSVLKLRLIMFLKSCRVTSRLKVWSLGGCLYLKQSNGSWRRHWLNTINQLLRPALRAQGTVERMHAGPDRPDQILQLQSSDHPRTLICETHRQSCGSNRCTPKRQRFTPVKDLRQSLNFLTIKY